MHERYAKVWKMLQKVGLLGEEWFKKRQKNYLLLPYFHKTWEKSGQVES